MSRQFVTPKCCAAAKSLCTVYLDFEFDVRAGEMVYSVPPSWKVRTWDAKFEITGSEPARYCPHCGLPVPAIVKVKVKKKIYTPNDGYCGTCKKRNRECNCLPPEFAWGPK